ARHVLLRRAGHLHPRRIRRPAGGLLAYDRGGPEALHPLRAVARRPDLKKNSAYRSSLLTGSTSCRVILASAVGQGAVQSEAGVTDPARPNAVDHAFTGAAPKPWP